MLFCFTPAELIFRVRVFAQNCNTKIITNLSAYKREYLLNRIIALTPSFGMTPQAGRFDCVIRSILFNIGRPGRSRVFEFLNTSSIIFSQEYDIIKLEI